jgi:hypothetical protein
MMEEKPVMVEGMMEVYAADALHFEPLVTSCNGVRESQ